MNSSQGIRSVSQIEIDQEDDKLVCREPRQERIHSRFLNTIFLKLDDLMSRNSLINNQELNENIESIESEAHDHQRITELGDSSRKYSQIEINVKKVGNKRKSKVYRHSIESLKEMSNKTICNEEIPENVPSKKVVNQNAKELSKNICFTKNYVHVPTSIFSETSSDEDDQIKANKNSNETTPISTVNFSECRSRLRGKAMVLAKCDLMLEMIDLLLERGADPNLSSIPLTALFFAVQNADALMVKKLLLKGANPNVTLGKFEPNCIRMKGVTKDSSETIANSNIETLIMNLECNPGGLTPLHFAVLIPDRVGVEITRMLLEALADPNLQAQPDGSFCIIPTAHENSTPTDNKKSSDLDVWALDPPTYYENGTGRTPLHLACARDYQIDLANEIVKLLLAHNADPNLICNGQSPLSLAIASGNDEAIDNLLSMPNIKPSQLLSHGWGSALCVAASPFFEFRKEDYMKRINLMEKLIDLAQVDPIEPLVEIPPRGLKGNIVDYVHYHYAQDKRISSVPYHALTPLERDTFVGRKTIMSFLATKVRESASKRALQLNQYRQRLSESLLDDSTFSELEETHLDQYCYCYECGRSVGVKLIPCTRCRQVFYCSKNCKTKAWTSRHKDECARLGGKDGRKGRKDSPTPAAEPYDNLGAPYVKNIILIDKAKNLGQNINFGVRREISCKASGWPGINTGGLALTNYLAQRNDQDGSHPARRTGQNTESYLRVDSRGQVVISIPPTDGNYSLI